MRLATTIDASSGTPSTDKLETVRWVSSIKNIDAIQSILVALIIANALFFVHPYLVMFVAALLSVYIRIDKRITIPSLSIALSIFWASRNLRVTWSTGADDAISYLDAFKLLQNESFSYTIHQFLQGPKNNEALYFLFTQLVGRFTTSEWFFVLLIYLTISLLTLLAAYLTNPRYYIIVAFLFLFGIGAFTAGPILHLWRSTLSSLMLYIGVIAFVKDIRGFKVFLLGACLVHLVAAPFALMFLVYQKFHFVNKPSFIAIGSGALIAAITLGFSYLDIIIPGIVKSYFSNYDDLEIGRTAFALLTLAVMFHYHIRGRYNALDSIVLTGLIFLPIAIVINPLFLSFFGRISTFLLLFYNYAVFRILLRYKYILPLILSGLFVVQFYRLANSEIIIVMLPHFSNVYNGIFFQ